MHTILKLIEIAILLCFAAAGLATLSPVLAIAALVIGMGLAIRRERRHA